MLNPAVLLKRSHGQKLCLHKQKTNKLKSINNATFHIHTRCTQPKSRNSEKTLAVHIKRCNKCSSTDGTYKIAVLQYSEYYYL